MRSHRATLGALALALSSGCAGISTPTGGDGGGRVEAAQIRFAHESANSPDERRYYFISFVKPVPWRSLRSALQTVVAEPRVVWLGVDIGGVFLTSEVIVDGSVDGDDLDAVLAERFLRALRSNVDGLEAFFRHHPEERDVLGQLTAARKALQQGRQHGPTIGGIGIEMTPRDVERLDAEGIDVFIVEIYDRSIGPVMEEEVASDRDPRSS